MRPLALTLAGVLLLAGCGSQADSSGGAATPPPAAGAAQPTTAPAAAEPHTEAAVRAAATEEFGAYASGDYGAAWDLWYAPAKKLLSRADYMRLFQLCPSAGQGIKFTIEKIAIDSGGQSARVRTSRLIAELSYQFVYESGHWRFVPDADSMRDYRTKTVEQMVQERRSQGGCGKT